MEALQARLFSNETKIRSHREILYEIHYRVPRVVSSPCLASHFTLARRSPEDKYYERAVEEARRLFQPGGTGDDSVCLPADIFYEDASFWTERYNEVIESCRREGRALQISSRAAPLDPTNVNTRFAERPITLPEFIILAGRILDRIKHHYVDALALNPGVFVFGAIDHIFDWVVRRVTDEFGDEQTLNLVIGQFCNRFEASYTNILKDLNKRVAPRRFQDEFDSRDYGSVRHWMEHLQPAGENIIEADSGGPQEYDDFKHYKVRQKNPLPAEHAALSSLNQEIRWSRFPQAWNYTFLEAPTRMIDLDQNAYDPHYKTVADLIFTWIIEPSVVNSIRYPVVPKNRHFPGRMAAGAHYLLIGIGELLFFSVAQISMFQFPDQGGLNPAIWRTALGTNILQRVSQYRCTPATLPPDQILVASHVGEGIRNDRDQRIRLAARVVRIALRHLGKERFDELCRSPNYNAVGSVLEPEKAGELSWAHCASQLATKIIESLANAGTNDLVRGQIGRLVTEIIRLIADSRAHPEQEYRQLSAAITDLTKSLWTSTVSKTASGTTGSIATDFVGSAMVSGRCIYFSNFLPVSNEEFTRTIFVDLGMTPHQRARVLQRMCDVMTYRSLAIRDLDKVKPAVEALSDLTRRMNNIQMRSRFGTDEKPFTSGDETPEGRHKLIAELRFELADILAVSESIGRLNNFFTYGISGKGASTAAYYEQILERCEDLREQRIPGYPIIADFVKRRIKHSVRYVERLHALNSTLSHRTTELLDRVRTSLEELQTQINDGRERQMNTLTEKISENVLQQVNLTRAADILIVISSVYYMSGLMMAIMPIEFIKAVTNGWLTDRRVHIVVELLAGALSYAMWRLLRHSNLTKSEEASSEVSSKD
jgi:uncharacterized membrane-anchored protein